jgi:hypothetical protein
LKVIVNYISNQVVVFENIVEIITTGIEDYILVDFSEDKTYIPRINVKSLTIEK